MPKPARGGSRRLTAAQRREDMIAGARRVFVRHGLSGARTRDIAKEAGVSEAIIYRHFASKDDLFEAAILEPLEQHLLYFGAGTTDFAAVDSRERHARSVEVHIHALEAMKEILPLLGVAVFAEGQAGKTFYRKRVAPFIDRGAELMARSLEGWPHATVDPEFLFKVVFGVYLVTVLDSSMRDQELDVQEVADRLTRLLAATVAPPAGRGKAAPGDGDGDGPST